jgi:hypothetical protein
MERIIREDEEIKLQADTEKYEGASKSFRTQSIKKYTLTTINTRLEATQRVMAATITRLTHKVAIQLHLVAESCTICSSGSRGQSGNFWIHPRMSLKLGGGQTYERSSA